MNDKWVVIDGQRALISGNTFDSLMDKYNNGKPLKHKGISYSPRKYGKSDLVVPEYVHTGIAFVVEE